MATLREQIVQLKAELEDASLREAQAQKQLEQKTRAQETLERCHARQRETIAEQREKISQLNTQIAGLDDRTQEILRELGDLRQALQKAASENASLRNQVSVLAQSREDASLNISTLNARIRKLGDSLLVANTRSEAFQEALEIATRSPE